MGKSMEILWITTWGNFENSMWVAILQTNKKAFLALITKDIISCSQTGKPWGMGFLHEDFNACASVRPQHRPLLAGEWGKKAMVHDMGSPFCQ